MVKFMHPHGPSQSFYCPLQDDSCAVPTPHIIAIIDPRKTYYQFSADCIKSVQANFDNYKDNKQVT